MRGSNFFLFYIDEYPKIGYFVFWLRPCLKHKESLMRLIRLLKRNTSHVERMTGVALVVLCILLAVTAGPVGAAFVGGAMTAGLAVFAKRAYQTHRNS